MSKTTKELLEMKDMIISYTSSQGIDTTTLIKRYERGYYSHSYFKQRIQSAIHKTIRKELAEKIEGVSHAGYAYPSVEEVLDDMYKYKQYKMRNENENKNENISTGL